MTNAANRLRNPPIMEAVLDIECDLPPGNKLSDIEGRAKKEFSRYYPKTRIQFIQEHKIESKMEEAPKIEVRRAVQALQFLQNDEKQLVQVRTNGFSFNRLSPYTCLDDYLSEIEQCWRIYLDLASPVLVRLIRLRYINRMLLPFSAGRIELNDYLRIGPHLPGEEKDENLEIISFLHQYVAIEKDTGHRADIVLTAQNPLKEGLPVILDNSATATETYEPTDWAPIQAKILLLRDLEDRLFREAVTEKCLTLFQ